MKNMKHCRSAVTVALVIIDSAPCSFICSIFKKVLLLSQPVGPSVFGIIRLLAGTLSHYKKKKSNKVKGKVRVLLHACVSPSSPRGLWAIKVSLHSSKNSLMKRVKVTHQIKVCVPGCLGEHPPPPPSPRVI